MDKLEKAKILKTYFTTEGTLYKDSIVKIENNIKDTVRVKNNLGKIYYVNRKDIVLL
tara:strand:- start:159 stop:329 length:171 start_codon:yes stop_codon:yes gene_type:complete